MDSYNDYFTEEEVGTFGEYPATTSLNNIPSLPPVTQYKGYKIVSKEIASEPTEGEFMATNLNEGATFGEYKTTTKINGVDSMFTPSIDPQPLDNKTFEETTPFLESAHISPSIPVFETSSSLQNIENSTYETDFDYSVPNQEIGLDFATNSSSFIETDNLQNIPDYTPILDTENLQNIPDYSSIIETEKLQSIPDYAPIFETEKIQSTSSPIIETENLQTISSPIIDTSNLQSTSSPIIETSNLQTITSPIIETTNLPTITNPIIETTNLQTIPSPIIETTNLQTVQTPIVETTNIQTIPKVNVSTYQATSPTMDLGINYENPSTIISPVINTYPVTTIQQKKISSPNYSIVKAPIVTSSIVSSTNVMPAIKSILPPVQSTIVTNTSPISLSVLPPTQSTIVTKTLPSTQSILPPARTTILTNKVPKTQISYVSSPLYKTVSSVVPRPKPVYTNVPLIPIQPSISLTTYTSKPVYTTLPPVNIISQPIYSTLSSTPVRSGPLYSTYSSPLVRIKSKPSYSELTVPFIPVHHRPIFSLKKRSSSALIRPAYNFSTFTVPLQHKSLYSNLSTIPVTQQQIPIYSTLSTIPVTQKQMPTYSTFSTYTIPKYHTHTYSSLSLPSVSSKPLYSSFTVNSSMPTQTLSQIPIASMNYSLGSVPLLSKNPYVNASTVAPLIGMNRQPIYSNSTYGTKRGQLPIYNSLIGPAPNMIQPGQYKSRTYTARRL